MSGCSPVGSCCAACAGHAPPIGAKRAALALRDPHALKVEAQRAGQNMGDLFPTVVFPADVKAYKRKLDPSFRATNADVSACATLPAQEARAWSDFFTEWRAFVDNGTQIFASWEGQLEQAKRYERDLADWQQLLSKHCKLSSPPIEPPSKPFPTGAVLVLGGAAVVVAALGYSFYRTAQQAGERAQAGKRFIEREVDRRLDAGLSPASSGKSSGKALARR